tara:strand:+ start:1597 stop:1941 length:345 start_codon:yes stop_codon:yes gene_type:complete
MAYVISTQILENYGAHTEDGRYANGNAYWKFKGGMDYLIKGLDRAADAVAFAHAYINRDMDGVQTNSLSIKEYICTHCHYDEWLDSIADLHEDYQQFKKEELIEIDVTEIFRVE